MTIIIHGPQGCGKTFHAQALARHFGCARIVDDWDGKTALQPGDLALTNMPACQLSAINDVHVMSFGVAICRAGAAQTVFLSEECQPVALAEAPKTARLDMTPYCGDDYDRMGCRAAIDVGKYGYRLSIFAPNGAWMESYRPVKSAAAVGRMLNEWLNGQKPRLSCPEDQSGASKS